MNNRRIVFMGTPEFAVESLKALLLAGKNVIGVVTAPDKPAGRGKIIQSSPVKKFAEEYNLKILQPEKLKDPLFIESLKQLKPDIQVVVAFRMLPEVVWSLPKLGTFNLHASLLPQYRGAAPINWAVINGEKETGLTTFLLNNEIDTGKIIFKEKVAIGEKETAGELHDRLMIMGSKLVVKTVDSIFSEEIVPTEQMVSNEPLKMAPKIFKENCKINWENDVSHIYNFIRGLSPYPGAYTELVSPLRKILMLKIFIAEKLEIQHSVPYGTIETDGKIHFRISAKGGYIDVQSLQLAGKNRMNIKEFLKGFQNPELYKIALF